MIFFCDILNRHMSGELHINQSMTLLILSCKDFSDLWSNNLLLLSKYWPEHPKTIISSEGEGKFDLKHPDELRIFEGEMSNRIISALKSIDTEYVLLTFDDYFLKDKVDINTVESLLNIMNDNSFDYCRFFKEKKVKGKFIGKEKYKILPLESVYEANFYPSIWKRESLLSVLKDGEDIWKTEVRLTKRMRELGQKGIAVYNPKVFPILDVVRKGKYLRDAYKFLKKNKLYISDRPIRTVKETRALALQIFVSEHFPNGLKKIIKEHMKKKGKVFYSDFEEEDE